MKTTIGQRIVEFVNRRNMTPLDFSIRLGYTSTSEFSRIKNGKEVSDVVIRKFLAAFPEIRREWLIDGKGDPEAVKDPWQEDRPRHLIELKADENGKRIPFYDTDVYATITPSLSDTPTMKPSAFISIPMFSQGEAAVQVTGQKENCGYKIFHNALIYRQGIKSTKIILKKVCKKLAKVNCLCIHLLTQQAKAAGVLK